MSDIHLVPVKAKDLDAVYNLLSKLNAAPHADQTETVDVPKNGAWSRSDLEQLAAMCGERSRAILDRVAEASLQGADATYGDLQEVAAPLAKDPSAYGFNNLRADLAWIAKYAKKVKDGANVWPMTVKELDESHAKGDRYIYRMPKRVAEWWQEINGAD